MTCDCAPSSIRAYSSLPIKILDSSCLEVGMWSAAGNESSRDAIVPGINEITGRRLPAPLGAVESSEYLFHYGSMS